MFYSACHTVDEKLIGRRKKKDPEGYKMRTLPIVLPLAILISLGFGLWSCTGGDGPIWGGYPDYPAGQVPGDYVEGFSVVLTNNMDFAIILLDEGGQAMAPMTETDGSGNIEDITGTVMIGPDNDTFIVRYDSIGWPKHVVYGDFIYFYANWTETTVDIAVMAADGTYEAVRGVDRGAQSNICPLPKPWLTDSLYELQDQESLKPLNPNQGNTGNTGYQLSQIGRSTQCYGYSVVPRPYSPDQDWKETIKWAGVGVQTVGCGVSVFTIAPVASWVSSGGIIPDGFLVIDENPYISAVSMTYTPGTHTASPSVSECAKSVMSTAKVAVVAGEAIWETVTLDNPDLLDEFYDQYDYDYVW